MAAHSPTTELDPSVVAIAISGARSRRAVRWAAENLIRNASGVLLLHVIPPLSVIPNPLGEYTPVEQVARDVLEMFKQDRLMHTKKNLVGFKRLCQASVVVDILVLVGEDPAVEIVRFVSSMGIKNLVLGASTFSWFTRSVKGMDVPENVLRSAPNACNIFLVSRWRVEFKLANQSLRHDVEPTADIKSIQLRMFTQSERSRISNEQIARHRSMPLESHIGTLEISRNRSMPMEHNRNMESSLRPFHHRESQVSMDSDDLSHILQNSELVEVMSPIGEEQLYSDFNRNQLAPRRYRSRSLEVIPSKAKDLRNQGENLEEVERLRLELDNTLVMYNRACKDLIYTRKKVEQLSVERFEDERKMKSALEREEIFKWVAAEEQARHLEAVEKTEMAKQLLAQAALDRYKAEIKARKESSEKQKMVDAIFSSNSRVKRYSLDEIAAVTDNFSDAKKIGEGGYGNVYKCNLDHMPVAIKVLLIDAKEKKEQFLKEVEVLTQLNHPNIVLLLGVCPEKGCLIYEYMENGSLEDRLFCKDDTQPLPWHARFRIIFEVACGLAFLHSSKPDPIVHCDMKPGNILLDRNYSSKIGDVGLARLMSNVVPDSITEYRDTLIAGTLHYMDPEYQRTGTLRPKSDLYAFGIIVLQVLTARHPLGLPVDVETAIESGCFADILDKTVTGWPLEETEKLAKIALKCSKLKCRDRPDLESEVLPEIEQLLEVSDARFRQIGYHVSAPNHYFCPILKQVMDDPYIAADGFSYEHRAIKAWLAKHNVSPVTKLEFEHIGIIPNHTLRSAIQEWRSHMEEL